MSPANSPCLNCKKRTITCKFDNTCEAYPAYRKEQDDIRKRIDEEKAKNRLLNAYQKSAAEASKKGKR